MIGPIRVHSQDITQRLKKANKIAADTLSKVLDNIPNFQTTEDIDKMVHDYIISQGAYPSPINYMGFPKSVCTSVNEVVVHGIPNNRPLGQTDYVNVDITVYIDGVHGDTSGMIFMKDCPNNMKQDLS